METKTFEKKIADLKNELIAWLNDECPSVAPPLEPYDNSDLSHNFCEHLRIRLDELSVLRAEQGEKKEKDCTNCKFGDILRGKPCSECKHGEKWESNNPVEQSGILSAEERLNNFGYFLIKQGYGIDITDDIWMEDWLFSEHKVRDIYELCEVYHAQFKELPEEELRKELVKFSDAFNNTGHIYITSGFIDEQLKNR